MYNYNLKREIIKNSIYIFFILLIAVVSTYYIYNKFQGDRELDINSESLDVTYHETTGNQINLTKVVPVTDSVGLSSKSYTITIKNNLTEKVDYNVKISDAIEKIAEDQCEEYLIPKDALRISIKNGNKGNKIYDYNEIVNDILLEDTMEALETKNLSIRVWVKQDSNIPMGANMHYHGTLQIVEGKQEEKEDIQVIK